MRLPWISQNKSQRGALRRKRSAPLRVRRLERRRVLDAAVTDLVFAPTDVDPSTAVHDSNEGTQITVTADPTGSGSLIYDWQLTQGANVVATGHNASFQFTPLDNANYSVSLTVTDSNNTVASRTESLIVHNIRPVLVLATDQTVKEGETLNLSAVGAPPLGLYIDLGLLDTHTATVNWGDGSPTEAPTIFAAAGTGALGGTHIYTGEGTYKVTVSVTDDDGGSDTKSFFVKVTNANPTAALGNSGPVDEGATAVVSFSSQTDPNPADVAAGFRYAYDLNNDGTFDIGDGTYAGSVTSASQMVSAALLAEGPATRTVRARIIDVDNGFTDYMTDITVNNAPPQLVNLAADDATIDEGQTATIKMTVDDPSISDVFAVDVNWKDGAPVDTIVGLGLANASGTVGGTTYAWDAASRQLTVSHLYRDDNPTVTSSDVYAVALAVRDDDLGMSPPYQVDITVGNVRPVLVVAANQNVNEGALLNLSGIGGPALGLYIDNGILDTHTATVDWGDGSAIQSPTILAAPGAGTLGATHTYKDEGMYTVKVTVTDDDGGTDMKSFIVKVGNVDPSIDTLSITMPINEGQSATLSGTYSDPGVLDTHELDIDWDGDNVFDQTVTVTGGSFNVAHLYPDDNPTGTPFDTFTVHVRLRDNDGGSDLAGVDLTVNNRPPVLIVALPQTINEGALLNLSGIGGPSLGLFVDDGKVDTHTATVNWGDGSAVEAPSIFFADGAGALGATHTFADDGIYTVTVTVTDDDGGVATKSFSVTVKNADPTLTVTPSANMVNEGTSIGFNATFSDPGFDNPLNPGAEKAETFTYDVDWGDGRDQIVGMSVVDTNGGPGVPSTGMFGGNHIYADDGTYTVTVTIHDDDGGSLVQQFMVTVKNADPTLTVTPSANMVNEGTSIGFNATFSDPGFDNPLNPGAEKAETFTYDVDWGDGRDGIVGMSVVDTNGGPGVPSTGMFGGNHIYADDGTYTVTVTIHDDDGGSLVQQFMVTVKNADPTLTVTPSANMVNEGTSIGFNATFSDPGFDNPLNPGAEKAETFTYDVDWGDGRDQIVGMSVVDTNGGPGVPSTGMFGGNHIYADDGTYTVTVTIHDDDGGIDTKTFQIIVNNVKPMLSIEHSNAAINEGQTVSFDAKFSDPGFDNPLNPGAEKAESFTYDVDWGDGRNAITGQAVADANGGPGVLSTGMFSGTHVYADDGTYTVKITIHDDDGGEHLQMFTVIVTNVAPALTIPAVVQADEGQLISLGGLGIGLTDPGFDNPNNPTAPPIGDPLTESFRGYTVNWGDGTAPDDLSAVGRTSDLIDGPTTASFTSLNQLLARMDHVYADNGTYTVTIRLADDNMAAFANPALFADNAGAGTNYVDLTFEIQVNNVLPSLTLPNGNLPANNQTILESQTISLVNLGVITDHGFNNPNNPLSAPAGSVETFRYLVIWDDGTFNSGDTGAATIDDIGGEIVNNAVDLTDASFDGSHTFADNGIYTVRVRVADDDMTGNFATGIAGIDYVEKTFQIIVTNVPPQLNPFPGGKKLQGDDINKDGLTTIRLSLHDPGYDNSLNSLGSPNGGEQFETFTYIVDWGDGKVDAIHLYTETKPYTVIIKMDGVEKFNGNFNGDPKSLFTLVSGQDNLYDSNVAATLHTFTIDWGDGTVDTVQLLLKNLDATGAPGAPIPGSSQTVVTSAPRVSGGSNVETIASGEVQHTYTGPPDALHPTNDVPIRLTLLDDDGGMDGGLNDPNALILVPNPGIQVIMVAIDTTPDVPRLDLTEQPMTDVFVSDAGGLAQLLQVPDVRGGGGEVAANSERYLELRVVYPDGTESNGLKIKDEALADLRAFFKTLPDGRYRIYLVRTENHSSRLVIEVDVRHGRVIDVSDDSEGTRDRPPTDEGSAPNAVPLDQNPNLEPRPVGERQGDLETRRPGEVAESATLDDRQASLSPGLPASLSLAALAATEPWSRRVDEALAGGDENAWRRLRRAGRRGRVSRLPQIGAGSRMRTPANLDYNKN